MERIPPNGSLFLGVLSGVAQASRRLGRPDCLEWFSPKIFSAASKPKIRDSGLHRDPNLLSFAAQNLHRDSCKKPVAENSTLTELFL